MKYVRAVTMDLNVLNDIGRLKPDNDKWLKQANELARVDKNNSTNNYDVHHRGRSSHSQRFNRDNHDHHASRDPSSSDNYYDDRN